MIFLLGFNSSGKSFYTSFSHHTFFSEKRIHFFSFKTYVKAAFTLIYILMVYLLIYILIYTFNR